MGWVVDTLPMYHVFQVDGKVILTARAMKLSKIANTSTVIVRHKATFIDHQQSILSDAQVFGEDYSVRFINVCKMYIVYDVMSSNFLSANSKAIYSRYIRAGERIIKHTKASFLCL